MATYDRHHIEVGSKVKALKIHTKVDTSGSPYWKFYVPFIMRINGNPIIYKHLWCRVKGRPFVEEGDWVEITRIVKLHTNCSPNTKGGMEVFEDLVVEVEKVVREREYE